MALLPPLLNKKVNLRTFLCKVRATWPELLQSLQIQVLQSTAIQQEVLYTTTMLHSYNQVIDLVLPKEEVTNSNSSSPQPLIQFQAPERPLTLQKGKAKAGALLVIICKLLWTTQRYVVSPKVRAEPTGELNLTINSSHSFLLLEINPQLLVPLQAQMLVNWTMSKGLQLVKHHLKVPTSSTTLRESLISLRWETHKPIVV